MPTDASKRRFECCSLYSSNSLIIDKGGTFRHHRLCHHWSSPSGCCLYSRGRDQGPPKSGLLRRFRRVASCRTSNRRDCKFGLKVLSRCVPYFKLADVPFIFMANLGTLKNIFSGSISNLSINFMAAKHVMILVKLATYRCDLALLFFSIFQSSASNNAKL